MGHVNHENKKDRYKDLPYGYMVNWFYPVTAPSEAEDTEFAYFAMTPRV